MSIYEILATISLITLFCCGLTVITEDGMLLGFLRKPFVGLHSDIEKKERRLEFLLTLEPHKTKNVAICESNEKEITRLLRRIPALKTFLYLSKPIILCCTCMSSVWGMSIFYALHGMSFQLLPTAVICCIAAAFLNSSFITLWTKL